jgi:uncharacterized protein
VSQTQILEAARQLDPATIRRLLSTRPELIRAVDRGGRSLLQLACLARCKELGVPSSRALAVAALLFEDGVDIESGLVTREGHYVNSVWFAVRGGNPRLISFLIGRGAKPCGLFSAGWQENLQAIRLLLDAGAQIDEVVDGETPFLHCWKNRKFRSAQFLIDRGANPNFQDSKGKTALHHGLDKGFDPPLLGRLIRKGASPDIADKKGRTPRQVAARKRDRRHSAVIPGLLQGALPNQGVAGGRTAASPARSIVRR